jgi:hypothetical protein
MEEEQIQGKVLITDTALVQSYRVSMQSTLILLTGKQELGRSVEVTSREGTERLLSSVVHCPCADAAAVKKTPRRSPASV